jgi:hypothetical protein
MRTVVHSSGLDTNSSFCTYDCHDLCVHVYQQKAGNCLGI